MKRSITVKQKKRKPGRPATGETPLVAFRPPDELRNAIDAFASAEGITRSEALRQLVELGLKAKPAKKGK
jgi:hypothetical protein